MGALLYFGGKFLAYSAWCYFGLRVFRPQDPRTLGRAIIYGMIRLSLGFFFGILIYFLSSALVTSLFARSSGKRHCLSIRLRSRAVDRMDHHGHSDIAWSHFSFALDCRKRADGSLVAIGRNRHLLSS